MAISKTFMITIYILVGIYLLYRVLFKKDRFQEEYEDLYNKILTSKEYKVKGQYEKWLLLFLKIIIFINYFKIAKVMSIPDLSVKEKTLGNISVKKVPYKPSLVKADTFYERMVERQGSNWPQQVGEIEKKIRVLLNREEWLRHNLVGEENIFTVDDVDYFPFKVKDFNVSMDGGIFPSENTRYLTQEQIDFLTE